MMNRIVLFASACAAALIFSGSVQAQSATNDSTATFADGAFNLPELANKEQYYVIVIDAPGELEKRAPLELPKGVTGIRLSRTALPKGSWTWRYERAPSTLAVVATVEPAPGEIPFDDLRIQSDETRVMFRWRATERATKYVLTYTADTPSLAPSTNAKPKPTKVEIDAEQFFNRTEQREFVAHSVKADPGTRFRWHVEAVTDNGIAIAKSSEVESSLPAPWYAAAQNKKWSLQKSDTLTKTDKGLPASFGYVRSTIEGKVGTSNYQTEFALIWNGENLGYSIPGFDLAPRASFEARLHSSGKDKESDAVRGRLGVSLYGDRAEGAVNIKYDADSKFDTKKFGLEINLTPTFGPFWQYYPIYKKTDLLGNTAMRDRFPVEFMFAPNFGLELGKTLEVGSSKETKNTFVRYLIGLRGDAELNFMARMLSLPRVSAFGEATFRYLARENTDRTKNLWSTGLDFWVRPGITFALRYSVGRDTPTFTWARSGSANVGLKF